MVLEIRSERFSSQLLHRVHLALSHHLEELEEKAVSFDACHIRVKFLISRIACEMLS